MTLNTLMRNAIVDAIDAAIGTAGLLKLKETTTVLCTISLPNPAFGDGAVGVISKSGTWSGTITTGGTVDGAVLSNGAETVTITLTAGETAEELVLDEATLILGGTVTIDTATITQPAS